MQKTAYWKLKDGLLEGGRLHAAKEQRCVQTVRYILYFVQILLILHAEGVARHEIIPLKEQNFATPIQLYGAPEGSGADVTIITLTTITIMAKKALLMILDGWGIGKHGAGDVIFNTPTPVSYTHLRAHET